MRQADSPGATESGADLFDRWLAHRARTTAGTDGADHDTGPAPEAPLVAPVDAPAGPGPGDAPGDTPEPGPETPAATGAEPVEHQRPPRGGRRATRWERRASSAVDHDREAALAALRAESDPRRLPRTSPLSTHAGGVPHVVEFAPRRGPQLLITGILLACLASTGTVGWIAYQDRTPTAVASAAALAALAVFVWAVRAGSSPTRITATGGRLEIRRAGGRHVFDLVSPALPIEERGRPGGRGWKVIFGRRGREPFVVDASMVDPHEFSRVLDHYRPRS